MTGLLRPGGTTATLTDVTEALRVRLKADAILHASRTQPVKDRSGSAAPWVFYSWNITLTQDGAYLAGMVMLDRLNRHFRSTQLATYGLTGIPLVSACVLLGGGKYTGIVVRETRKKHGSCRQIDGQIDRTRPVVVVDDSLSSGTSLRNAIHALESEGLKVEGALALVEFPNRGGRELAEALGYRVESVFDIWQDLEISRPGHVAGFRRVAPAAASAVRIDDGLAPARVARLVAECLLGDTEVPQPPRRFDREYDGRGGVYVSFRDARTDDRLARDGFWHFDPTDAEVGRDVVLATLKTLRSATGTLTRERLPQLKIAVTFFGPLERIAPQQLDFDRYGIVVRSRAFETKIGGALPNTEVFTSEVEQYRHARLTNAKIGPFEPHDLHRHTVVKCPEEGVRWLRYGAPDGPESDWTRSDAIGARLTSRAREILLAPPGTMPQGPPLPDDLIVEPLYGLAVTLYHRGTLGCSVASKQSLDECVRTATIGAANDERFRSRWVGVALSDVSIAVSVLHDREWLGDLSVERAARKVRLGLDSVAVQQGSRRGILLASVAPHFNWTKEELARQLLRKARIGKPPYLWSTFKTATWVAHEDTVRAVRFGFSRLHSMATQDAIRLLSHHIMNSRTGDGLPGYCYFPIAGTCVQRGSAARVIHALIALHEAGRLTGNVSWVDAARAGLVNCLEHLGNDDGNRGRVMLSGYQSGAMADSQLLAGIALLGRDLTTRAEARALALRVAGLLQADGRVAERRDGLRAAQDHDFLPGAALWSLARFHAARDERTALSSMHPQFEWYRRRFRLLRRWGLAVWHMQAWALICEATGDTRYRDFVFEMADWALGWQLEKDGSFVTDLYPSGPSFHTAFVAEGIAAAWRLARGVGDHERTARYAHACRRAASFMSELIIRPDDTYCLRDPDRAIGGVRPARDRSDVRIDFVSHALLALVAGPDAGAPEADVLG